jgi:hypothetical protein
LPLGTGSRDFLALTQAHFILAAFARRILAMLMVSPRRGSGGASP